jgi:hypothetical protein
MTSRRPVSGCRGGTVVPGNQSDEIVVLLITVRVLANPQAWSEAHMINNHDLILMLMFSCSALFVTTITFATLWVRSRERGLRAELDLRVQASGSTAEMDHLVHAIDAIAVEVERISEAQRFTAQVLVDRKDSPAGAAKRIQAPERVNTPH